jgi:hypothetical protein
LLRIVPKIDGLSVVEATLLGWVCVALINTAMLEFPGVSGASSLRSGARVLLHLYDIGQTLALGGVTAGIAWGVARWTARPRWFGGALACAGSVAMGVAFLRNDLAGVAGRLVSGSGATLALYALCATIPLVVPFVAFLAGVLTRARWRMPLLALGSVMAAANYFVLKGDYPGAHLLFGAVAAVAIAGALQGAPRPRVRLKAVWLALVALGAFAVFLPPPASITADLGHTWTAALVKAFPRTVIAKRLQGGPARAEDVFVPGTYGGPSPPTSEPVVGPDAIVIYFSVDSMRADLLESPAVDDFPNFKALRDQGTWFSNARSPGTQTAVTLTSVMTGTYYSQQYWTLCPVPEGGGVQALFAHEDTSVRFPQLLSDAGIPTVHYGQAVWLLNKYGMARGFSEERFVAPVAGKPSTKGKWSTGDDVMGVIQSRLRSHGSGPLFLFFHDLDPHSPFDLGKLKKGPQKSLYLSEIALTDERLGRLRKTLDESGLTRRAVIILSSDHGEAFDEHGTDFHGQNLYDEQVRVPLVVLVPGQEPRRVDDPVTLMDLGPTILDLMRLPTPAHFMGQSLVAYWQGEVPNLTRPIIAEGRLKQSMLLPNGKKLIRNQQEGTFEVYDLKSDPKELRNIYDQLGPEGPLLMKNLQAFFETYRIRRPGYEIPFRR